MSRAVLLAVALLTLAGCSSGPPVITATPDAPGNTSSGDPAPPIEPAHVEPATAPSVALPFYYRGITEGEVCIDVTGEVCRTTTAGQNSYWRLPLAARYERLEATITWTAGAPDGFYVVLYRVLDNGDRESLSDAGLVALGPSPLRFTWDLSSLPRGVYDLGAFDGVEQRPANLANLYGGRATSFEARGLVALQPRDDAGRIVPVGPMHVPRAGHTATTLASGEVLVTGGFEHEETAHASAERFDPTTRAFRATGNLEVPRVSHEAVLLADGRVLVAGGYPRLSSAELYDPMVGTFSALPSMGEGRHGFTATLLPDGRVLIAGGGTRGAELFDPRTNAFVATASMAFDRNGHTATLLPAGIPALALSGPVVLIAGGRSADGRILSEAEAYHVSAGTFVSAGAAQVPRYKHAALLDPAGEVLLLGGSDERDWAARYADIERYDPRTGAFVAEGGLATSRFKVNHAVALVQGRPFVAGGGELAEVLTPDGPLPIPGIPESLFLLAAAPVDGGALVVGGYNRDIVATSDAWLFEAPRWRPSRPSPTALTGDRSYF